MTRIPQVTIHRRLLDHIDRAGERMARLQMEIATGRRVRVPSDDAVATARGLAASSDIRRSRGFVEAGETLRFFAIAMETTLGEVSDIVGGARVVAVEAGNDAPGSEDDDAALAEEVNQALESLVEAANRRHHEGYVFGGKLSDLEPYAVTRDANGDITAVTARPGIDEPITRMVGERPATFPITGPGVFAGGGDLFQTLIDLRDALLADDGAAVTAAAAALELIEHNVVDSQARLGSFTNRLDAAIEALESGQLRLEAERSRLLDADMADAALRLTTEETLYQAALEMAARVSELSLVNYL